MYDQKMEKGDRGCRSSGTPRPLSAQRLSASEMGAVIRVKGN